MIDWSSSDYIIFDNSIYYTTNDEGGVYMSKNNNLDDANCYKCSNVQIKQSQKIDTTNTTTNTTDISTTDDFKSKFKSCKSCQGTSIDVNSSNSNNSSSIDEINKTIYEFVLSDYFLIFLFFLIITFLVHIELRINKMNKLLKYGILRNYQK